MCSAETLLLLTQSSLSPGGPCDAANPVRHGSRTWYGTYASGSSISDFEILDKLLGDDLIYTHSSGQSDTHVEYISLCKKGVFQYRAIERPIENMTPRNV